MANHNEAMRLAGELRAPIGTQTSYQTAQQSADLLVKQAERIAELEARVHTCGPTCSKAGCINRRLAAERDTLRAEAERLRVDAERYEWLRRCRGMEHDPLFTVQHELDGTLWGGDLDTAIDTARKATP